MAENIEYVAVVHWHKSFVEGGNSWNFLTTPTLLAIYSVHNVLKTFFFGGGEGGGEDWG